MLRVVHHIQLSHIDTLQVRIDLSFYLVIVLIFNAIDDTYSFISAQFVVQSYVFAFYL